jgi:hypothetical protein
MAVGDINGGGSVAVGSSIRIQTAVLPHANTWINPSRQSASRPAGLVKTLP